MEIRQPHEALFLPSLRRLLKQRHEQRLAGLLEQSLQRWSLKLEADVRRMIQHPDHRVSDTSRLTTRSWGVPQPSQTSWIPAPPSNGLAWCSAILVQCLRSCARLPHSLAANLFRDLVPAPGRSLTSSGSLRSSFHRPSSEEGFRSGGSGSSPSHERNTYPVSPTLFRLASMVPPFLNRARSEELRFRLGTQRARHRGCQKRWLAKISLLLM
jgi:hypothetical protein